MATNNQIIKFPDDLESNGSFTFLSFNAFTKTSEKSLDVPAKTKTNNAPKQARAETLFNNPHSIYLFVPGAIADNTSVSYEDVGLQSAKQFGDTSGSITDYLSRVGSRLLSASGQNILGAAEALTGVKAKSAWEFGNQKLLNPQMEVLFKGIGFREHSFSFDMFPKNEKESQNIERIIRQFKYYSHPYLSGEYMQYPAYWQIEAKSYDGTAKKSKRLMKFHRAVITSVNVERNPTGVWSTFANGDPINTKITLTMKEIKQTMRGDIELDIAKESF